MKNILILFCALCIVSTAEAVLPPLYSSIAEIKAILDDKRLADELTAGQAITDIKRTDTGYLVVTPKYNLQIDISYKPQKMPGPAHFEFAFHKKTAIAQ